MGDPLIYPKAATEDPKGSISKGRYCKLCAQSFEFAAVVQVGIMLQPEDESSTDLSMVRLERKQQEGSVHKCVKGFGRSLMFQALRVQNL